METKWLKCDKCNHKYPSGKHNFKDCKQLDPDWHAIINTTKCKPCLKWVGGKQQLINTLRGIFRGCYHTYYEPFVGGGSVLLMVMDMIDSKEDFICSEIKVSDLNWQLICMYNCIKNTPLKLMDDIDELYKHYSDAKIIEYEKRHKCTITTLEDAIEKGKKYVYYYYREEYNKLKEPSVRVASLFIILNKLCFRGLYRSSKNGFNVPYGNYKNPTIYSRNNIIKMSYLFNVHDVEFKQQSYSQIVASARDFVYLDPPYYPIRPKAFESYNHLNFDHEELVKFIKKCINFIHSNSCCEFNLSKYSEYTYKKILCKRRINSKKPADKDYEIIILSKSLQRK